MNANGKIRVFWVVTLAFACGIIAQVTPAQGALLTLAITFNGETHVETLSGSSYSSASEDFGGITVTDVSVAITVSSTSLDELLTVAASAARSNGGGGGNESISFAVEYMAPQHVGTNWILQNQFSGADSNVARVLLTSDPNTVLATVSTNDGMQAYTDNAPFTLQSIGTARLQPNHSVNIASSVAANDPPDVVPEPTSLALWSLGALGCAVAGYRRRKLA